MYRRKHRHKLRLARAVLILTVLASTWWVWQRGRANADIAAFSIDPEKTSRLLGNVLGAQIKRVSDLALQRLGRVGESPAKQGSLKLKTQNSKLGSRVVFKFGVISDSHEDTEYFPKILEAVRVSGADFVVHLGDLSNAADLKKLKEAKKILDKAGISYIVLPGDHDYNLQNFVEVFQEGGGWPVGDGIKRMEGGRWGVEDEFYFGLVYKGASLVFVDSSDNQNGVSEKQLAWLKSILEEPERMQSAMPTFIFTQAPPFSPYFEEKQIPNGAFLLNFLSGYKIDEIFAGNVHSYARYPAAANAGPHNAGIAATSGGTGDGRGALALKYSMELTTGQAKSARKITGNSGKGGSEISAKSVRKNFGNVGIEITTVGAVCSPKICKNFLPVWTEVVVYTDGGFTIEPKPLVESMP